MKFDVCDVMRLSYKWPHNARSPDGSKDRACVIFEAANGGYFVSPTTTVPPQGKDAKYAIPVSSALQRQLGLSDVKQSWLMANYVNFVEPPNPSIVTVNSRKHGMRWTHGRVPVGLLAAMKKSRDQAIASGECHAQSIRKEDPRDFLRAEARPAASGSVRMMPGDPRKRAALQDAVRQKAAEKAAGRETLRAAAGARQESALQAG